MEKDCTVLRNYLPKALFLLAAMFIGGLSFANAATLYGVTAGNSLVKFDSATPETLTTVGAISGLQSGENVLGIDFRPATGQLYALGSTSRLYTVNKNTGAATFVATLSTTLSGNEFGFDFNPTVDRIRIISNTGQNLRVNPTNGVAIVDGAINPGTPQVAAAAYTNSFSGTTTTTLYDVDSASDQLMIQTPPNSGVLVPVGGLGVDIGTVNGFDIFAGDGVAYLSATAAVGTGTPFLYTVNLSNGLATRIGAIGGTGNLIALRGLAAESGSTASNATAFALNRKNQIVKFNTQRPSITLGVLNITGLQAGETLVGIDFRPATGQLYGLGNASRLYVIDTVTGAATAVGAAGAFTLNGIEFGFDFNPTVDRIRVVSNTGQNLRLNPNDGTLSANDTALNPGTPQVTAAAYTNSFAGATSTTLYDIDSGTDSLFIQTPPNNGTLVRVGGLGMNITALNGFDIATASGTAFLATQIEGENIPKIYTVDLTTGSAVFIGPVGSNAPIQGLAIAPGSAASTTLDFDGDRRTNFAVFRNSNNTWYIDRNAGTNFYGVAFGLASTDVLVPGDYDGDGKTDVAVWRRTNGTFYIWRSSDGAFQSFPFGANGDEPVARDYDGDGKTDYAVVRRTSGLLTWYIWNSSNNSFRAEQFGTDTDRVAPGDYDGDGRFDLAVYRVGAGNAGTFYVMQSTMGFTSRQFGIGTDSVVPGDYDGDGKTDYAVVRRTGGLMFWYILRSSDNSFTSVQFGADPSVTAQGDYDGDGKTDIAIYNSTTATYTVLRSSTGATVSTAFGIATDYPIANSYSH